MRVLVEQLAIILLIVALSQASQAQEQTLQPLTAALDRALDQKQNDAVQQAVTEILALPSPDLDLLLATGGKLADRELFELSGQVFAKAVKTYPNNFEARYNLALTDFALRRFSEALSTLDGVQSPSAEQQLSCEYLRGKLYDALSQNDLAEKSFLAAVRGAPRQENYALDLGLHYLRRRLYSKALATLETAAKYHPDSLYLELEIGLAQVLGDDRSRAVATCRRILAKEPTFGPARLLLVVSYYLNGETENCLTETSAALLQPDAPPYLFYLQAASLLKLNSNDFPAMLHDLDEANRRITSCALCYFTQSKVHQEMGNRAAGIADLETLVTKVDPEFAQAWYRLSKMYQQDRRAADAAHALQRFRSIHTNQNAEEMEYLQKLLLSTFAAQ